MTAPFTLDDLFKLYPPKAAVNVGGLSTVFLFSPEPNQKLGFSGSVNNNGESYSFSQTITLP